MNFTSATSFGLTQVVTASSFTFAENGDFAVFELDELAVQLFKGLVAEACADMADIAPAVPFAHRKGERPEKRPRPSWSGEAGDDDFLALRVLIFSQSSVRAPDRYLLSARLAMMPSRPLRSASSKNFVPDVLR